MKVKRYLILPIFSSLLGSAVLITLLLLRQSWLRSSLAAWDAGAALYVTVFAVRFSRFTAQETQARAAAVDPGRAAVYALVVLGSAASLLSAVLIATTVKGSRESTLVVLSLANVSLSWALTHTAFALRYGHLYYRDDTPVGGVEFPGGCPPTYADFAYFAFTIGMTFQVSDTTVSDPQIRRTVLLQALLSFVYNTAIIAFVLNLVFALA